MLLLFDRCKYNYHHIFAASFQALLTWRAQSSRNSSTSSYSGFGRLNKWLSTGPVKWLIKPIFHAGKMEGKALLH